MVNPFWEKPDSLKNKKVLYIAPGNPGENPGLSKMKRKLIKNIYLDSFHKDVFVQFWEI